MNINRNRNKFGDLTILVRKASNRENNNLVKYFMKY